MGWTSNSSKTTYDSTWHNTSNSEGEFWSVGTNLPDAGDSPVSGDPTSEGFPINYYAVWQERDSVTINPSVSDITTVVFDNIPDAQDGLTYYFDRGTNKKVTIEINTSATGGKEYYINSVTGATGTITENGRRSWVGNNTANTGSTAVTTTINIMYHKNLKFHLHNYFIERTSFDPGT